MSVCVCLCIKLFSEVSVEGVKKKKQKSKEKATFNLLHCEISVCSAPLVEIDR